LRESQLIPHTITDGTFTVGQPTLMAFSQTVVLITNASIIILYEWDNTPVPIREKDWQYHD
jgi:hypothetical protein